MGRRLLTTSPRVNDSGELLVNYAANRDGGLQVGHSLLQFGVDCVPFSPPDLPLEDRKFLVLTFPTDKVVIGESDVEGPTGYLSRGAGRGAPLTNPPAIEDYSNRRQFLRGQYIHLAALSEVTVCAKIAEEPSAIEIITSIEAS